VARKRGLAEYVPMSTPMQLVKSRLEEIEELHQPLEEPKPPPPIPQRTSIASARTPVDHDPYRPEDYEVDIFRLMEEVIDGKRKPARFTVLDNALDVVRDILDVYGYAVYTLLYRYSYGFSRSTCALSYGGVAKKLKMSSKKAEQVLAELESVGLIEVIFPAFKKLRGKVYKVKLPREFVREREGELAKQEAFQELRRLGVL
jgi:hypothetical protein